MAWEGEGLELQQPLAGQAEGRGLMGTKRVCDSPMVPRYRRMPLVARMVLKALQVSGYERSGGPICTKRWTCSALSSTSTPISAWSVFHFLGAGRTALEREFCLTCVKSVVNGGARICDGSTGVVSSLPPF